MKKYINLLPPDYLKHIRLVRLNNEVIGFGIWINLSLLILAAVLFASFVIFRQKLAATEQEVIAQTKVLEEIRETSVRKDVEIYNTNLKNFETVLSSRDNWSSVLVALAQVLPDDVTLDSLTLYRLEKKVEISGHASTRNSVLRLRQNLLDSTHFVKINFPLSNLEKPDNLNWKYRFYVKPEFLK